MTLILSGSDGVTFPDSTEQETGYANGIGFRNRIINGDMRIDQRNAGASVTLDGSGVYPVDRWRCDEASDGGATGEQVQDAPTGFVDSLKITTTTADGTLSSAQYMAANQFVEGFNTADFGWGTANAKTVTLSFWVKSSLTGTFAAGIDNNAGNRSYVFNYTVSVADTWEYKTVIIDGDTSGTWNTGNARGLGLRFGLGAGTDFDGTVGSWQAASKFSSSGAVSVIGTLNATWGITGVQLEVGSVATPFERRPFGTELMLCKRYYEVFGVGCGKATTTTNAALSFMWTVEKRASPTLALISSITTAQIASPGVASRDVSALAGSPVISTNGIYSDLTTSGLTSNEVITSFKSDWLSASAEL